MNDTTATPLQPDEAFARQLDGADPLAAFRAQFDIPTRPDGQPVVYFAGNSLGLLPRAARRRVTEELDEWARRAVDAHFDARRPWYSYHEIFRDSAARLVGARSDEVVLMNSLTVNLHLMMTTFYRPTAQRYRILIDGPTFPSDLYAVKSLLQLHGVSIDAGLLEVCPRAGEHLLHPDDIDAVLAEQGDRVALVLFAGVNFFTGQFYDLPRITAAAHERGCVVGLDLAHAAGNVPLALHDWNVDFAAWCNYKYLNSGPGAVAGCFVHQRHGRNLDLPRLAGWWGNDPATRFNMHLQSEFVPCVGADGWQLSNPPILALAPVKAAYDLFDEATLPALRTKSRQLTGYLEWLLDRLAPRRFEIITPRDPDRRGCQLSLRARFEATGMFEQLKVAGIVCDFRPPDVIRVAPVPLYNTYHDVWTLARVLEQCAAG